MIGLFFLLFSIFSGTYAIYFVLTRTYAKKPWNLSVDNNFQPGISILIPVHNEESTIESKLMNIKTVTYPKDEIEVIVADDASSDSTLKKVMDFSQKNPGLKITIVRQDSHAGKSAALNKALPVSRNQLVVVTDADTQWPSNALHEAVRYLSDPRVGAVTSRGVNTNYNRSWVVGAEDKYLDLVSVIRLGESKMHSTIRFEGGLCVYRKKAFDKFDFETGADDSGTALQIVQNDYRAILAPEAIFYTQFPTNLTGKLRIKARRANQLIQLWVKCLRLMVSRKLLLPKKIAVPEILLFLFNPVILLILIADMIAIVILFPFALFFVALLVVCLTVLARKLFFEVLIDNFVLFYALLSVLFGKRYTAWEKQ